MATKKISLPFFHTHELIETAHNSEAVVSYDDIQLVNRGGFVVVWDGENPDESCLFMLPLHSITIEAGNKTRYTVLSEYGNRITFDHATVASEGILPYVVCKVKSDSIPCVGRLIGCFKDDTDEWKCCVAPVGSAPVRFCKADDVTYLDDVKFGIVKEESDGND